MRTIITLAATTMTLAAFGACFSEPARPHGMGDPIADGSVIRQMSAVGDLDGDGYDDLALFGNEGGHGINPTVFIYFGGESLENPDLRPPLAIDPNATDPALPDTWYEVLTGSIFVSTDGTVRGVALDSAQDSEMPEAVPGTDPTGTDVRCQIPQFLPVENRAIGTPQFPGMYITAFIGRDGYAPSFANVFALERDEDSSLPARRMLVGDTQVLAFDAPIITSESATTEQFTFTGSAQLDTSQVFEMPNNGLGEDMLVVTTDTVGPAGDTDTANGSNVKVTDVPLPIQNVGHRGNAHAVGNEMFVALATREFANMVTLVDATVGTPDVVTTSLLVANSPLDDVAYADVGGGSAADVISLEGGTLGVYLDVDYVAGGTSTPTASFGNRTALPGYDTLAVGNFFGDARLEIYAISSTAPATGLRCFHLSADATTLDPCETE